MALTDLLQEFRRDPQFMANVMAWRTLPARGGRLAAIPPALHPALQQVLRRRGIDQLYLHQAQAVDLALQRGDFAVVTPTASGKTLCYNLPVLHTLLSNPSARALYLFPTKALAHDQLDELHSWIAELESKAPIPPSPLPIFTYDGDTPSAGRAAIRRSARLILSNPDMLHNGILPYHTTWADFFTGLRYVVLDEMHTYRGVFGSHVANVLRRLQRVCAVYGSRPQFIATSATIANPQQLAERLVERPVAVIDDNGAPQCEKHLILYNPTVYDAERGLRRSSVLEAQELATRCLLGGLQTIIFARARLTTEVLLTYLRERINQLGSRGHRMQNRLADAADPPHPSIPPSPHHPHSPIRGYRGGYLPHERRAIEEGLRSGVVRGVVATNALELGIDIGQLQAAILCGYPGTIASTWQQMGRAGRTLDAALAILVATGGALDQYVIRHPEFLFERSPEQALINPDNLMILVEHMRCAAFELPFARSERFGASPFTADVLQLLVEEGAVQQHGEHFHWSGEGYPARRVSLRTTTSDTVAIQVQRGEARGRTTTQPEIIGVIDHASAPLLLHDGAVYLHEGQSYRVDQLDLAQNLAHVTPVAVDYYTEAATETQIDILAQHAQRQVGQARVAHGDLQVQSQVIGFRRVKRFTHENLGVQPLDYPPQVTETSGYWFSILPAAQRELEQAGYWFDSANDYGPNWQEQRNRVRARDGYRCTLCGAPEPPGRQHDVHHQRPFRTFGYAPGLNEHYLLANRLENLVLLCRNCHGRMEATVRVRTGLDGVAYALSNLAPLHLMCDAQDIGVTVVRPEGTGKDEASGENETEQDPLTIAQRLPTIFIYERAVAGLGFCARLYELHEQLLDAARELILSCPCRDGCPACVGPVLEDAAVFLPTKQLATALVDALGASLPTVQPALDEADFMG